MAPAAEHTSTLRLVSGCLPTVNLSREKVGYSPLCFEPELAAGFPAITDILSLGPSHTFLPNPKGNAWDPRTSRTSWVRVPNPGMPQRWLLWSSKVKGLPTPISRHLKKCIFIYAVCCQDSNSSYFTASECLSLRFLKPARVFPPVALTLGRVAVQGNILPSNFVVLSENFPKISSVLALNLPIFSLSICVWRWM